MNGVEWMRREFEKIQRPRYEATRRWIYGITQEIEQRRMEAIEAWLAGLNPSDIPLAANNRVLAYFPVFWDGENLVSRVALLGHDDPERPWEEIDERPKFEFSIRVKAG